MQLCRVLWTESPQSLSNAMLLIGGNEEHSSRSGNQLKAYHCCESYFERQVCLSGLILGVYIRRERIVELDLSLASVLALSHALAACKYCQHSVQSGSAAEHLRSMQVL